MMKPNLEMPKPSLFLIFKTSVKIRCGKYRMLQSKLYRPLYYGGSRKIDLKNETMFKNIHHPIIPPNGVRAFFISGRRMQRIYKCIFSSKQEYRIFWIFFSKKC